MYVEQNGHVTTFCATRRKHPINCAECVYFQKSPNVREQSVIEMKSDAGDSTMMLADPLVTVRISKQLVNCFAPGEYGACNYKLAF